MRLYGTAVRGESLAHLQSLYDLNLHNTPLDDAGLEMLTPWSRLDELHITKTKVTEAGVKKLAAALPACQIDWDGGLIEPAKK